MDAGAIDAILDRHDGWRFRGLALTLARCHWAAVKASTGLTRDNYGTARYLARTPSVARNELAIVAFNNAQADGRFIVEALDDEQVRKYSNLGLDFYLPDDIDAGLVRQRLDGALRRLNSVSDAMAPVAALMAVMHVLKPPGPEYDVSYSDPLLPFSIFVGIDRSASGNDDLRLAESILHECMHLQLTLVESVAPMIGDSQELHRSPWQKTMRPSQGILHGLYVFRSIQEFYRAFLNSRQVTHDERRFIVHRMATIEAEVVALRDFPASKDLTHRGCRLVAALLAK